MDRNEHPRTIPFGVRVRLQSGNNVTKESWGLLGTTVDPKTCDEFVRHSLAANPHFNVVRLDECPAHLIFMLDDSLDLVEGHGACELCGDKSYVVVLAGGMNVCDGCLQPDTKLPFEIMLDAGRIMDEFSEPTPGTWADVARIMAAGDDSDFDWDGWKDEMKEMTP